MRAGASARTGQWDHGFVQAEFVRLLIDRRKLYPSSLRDVLSRNYRRREVGDYDDVLVSRTEADRAVRRGRELVEAIVTRSSEPR